jgi:hypothetical protein
VDRSIAEKKGASIWSSSLTDRNPPANLHGGSRGETARDHRLLYPRTMIQDRGYYDLNALLTTLQPRSIRTLCDLQALAGYLPIYTSAMEVRSCADG